LGQRLRRSAKLLARLLGADFTEILTFPPGKKAPKVLAAYGCRPGAPPACNGDMAFYGRILRSPGPVTFLLPKGKSRSFTFSILKAGGIACGIAAPLPGPGKAIGVVGAYSVRLRRFTRTEGRFVASFASLVAATIEQNERGRVADDHGRPLERSFKMRAARPDLLMLVVRLEQLADRMRVRAITEERRRIALEIHDSIAQAFIGIAIQLQAAQQILENPSPQLRLHLQRAMGLAREATDEARRIIWDLKPSVLENTNLAGGLKLMANRIFTGTPIRVRFRCRGRPLSLHLDTEIELLRIAQEAMSNVLKHSGATEVNVDLNAAARGLEIRISDNGCGFSLQAAATGPGSGLKAMQERARRAGASVEIHSLRGRGTRVAIMRPPGLPMHEETQASAHSIGG
jgi:signal transduction histidine kinase